MSDALHGPTLKPLRSLGHAEKYSTTRSHLGIYLNVGLTARYKRPSGVSVKPALFHALKILISKHPILSAIPLACETRNPYFARLPQIVLSEVVTFVEEDTSRSSLGWQENLDKDLEEQHNRPFVVQPSGALPFWRIRVLESPRSPKSFTLVLIFHHSLMDTKSALSFHDELEGYMAHYGGGDPSDTVDEFPGALTPPLEHLYSLPISQEFQRSQKLNSEPSPDSWTAGPQSIPVMTRFSSLWLSTVDTKLLIELSRREQTSVTAALQTLISTCIFAVLPLRYHTLQADCAVSLRKFLPDSVNADTLGCYVGSSSTTYHRMPSFDWDEARRTKIAIERTMARKGADMPVGFLAFIPNQHDWMSHKLGRQRLSSFELSNIGTCSTSRGGLRFEIESLLFSQSSSACSAAIKISAVTGRDGRLALGFTWQEGIVQGDMIEQIKKAFKIEIARLT